MAVLLVVEGNANQRLLLEEELGSGGHSVLSAASGREALDVVRLMMPDLVVLDIGLPDMDGLELITRLLGINRRLRIVVYTGYECYRDRFVPMCADAYLVKKSDLSELRDTVRQLLLNGRGWHGKSPGLAMAPPEAQDDFAVQGGLL